MLQPPADAEALAPDVVLVPLVLADRRGTRIGHGKGHYDRALAHLREGGGPVFAIGLAWESQISDEPIPADPWDMPLDAIATPKRMDQHAGRAELAQARGDRPDPAADRRLGGARRQRVADLIAGRALAGARALSICVAGIVWILPLKPLLRWMETGRWR